MPAAPPAVQAQAPAVPWRKRYARGLRIAAGSLAVLVLLAGLWMLTPTGGMTPEQVEALVQKVLDKQDPVPTVADALNRAVAGSSSSS